MLFLLAVVRVAAALSAILIGMLVIVPASWLIRRRRHGVTVPGWLITWLARLLLWILHIRVHCPDRARLATHHGFVFPNHTSYLDSVILMAQFPLRWVAMQEVVRWPLVGRIAVANETIFVDRSDKQSRRATRDALSSARRYPPICLYPEGRVHAASELAPFRYGAFEVAAAGEVPVLPIVLLYENMPLMAELARTRGLFDGGWVTVRRRGRLDVLVAVMEPVVAEEGESAESLAARTHAAMSAVKGAFHSALPDTTRL